MILPSVTAILPCFNHASFLAERIRSVLAQSHPVSQLIFLDDASTDDSVQIARSLLADCLLDVEICVSRCNSGSPFAQWNKGVALAKHDLIWIAETDDSCEPELLKSLLSHLLQTNAALSFCQSRLMDSSGVSLGSALAFTEPIYPGVFAESFSMEGSDFAFRYLSAINVIPNASAVVFQRRAFLAAGKANASMRYAGDWLAWIDVARQGRVAFLAADLNTFRCHPGTTRAKGYTSDVAAEYLACRLTAMLPPCQPGPARITAFQCLKRWPGRQSDPLFASLAGIPYAQVRETRAAYRILRAVPDLSDGVWIAIWLMRVVRCAGRKALRLLSEPIAQFCRRFSMPPADSAPPHPSN